MVRPRPTYRLATETTSRRLASISRRLAIRPLTTSRSRSTASWESRSGKLFSFSSANRPASTRRASSTSSTAVSSGMRPISRRYCRKRSADGPADSSRDRRSRWSASSSGSSGRGSRAVAAEGARRSRERGPPRSGSAVSGGPTSSDNAGSASASGRSSASAWVAAWFCSGTLSRSLGSASATDRTTSATVVRVWVCTGATSMVSTVTGSETRGIGTVAAWPLSAREFAVCGSPVASLFAESGIPRSEDSGTALSVSHDTPPLRGACGGFFGPMSRRAFVPSPDRNPARGPPPRSTSSVSWGELPALGSAAPPSVSWGELPALARGHLPALARGHLPALARRHLPALARGHPQPQLGGTSQPQLGGTSQR
ncbi:hypothetical protein M2266_002320 [Streptomyces sp. SPB162]|nr:hypothetical protein [Streptomyces sp. SPB162]